jgi:hypothetical protein
VPPELNDHVRLEEDAASPVDAAAGRRGTIDT